MGGATPEKSAARPRMKLKASPSGKPLSKPRPVRAKKPVSSVAISAPKHLPAAPLVLTDASGQKISLTVRPDGSTEISRSGPPPPPSSGKIQNTMVLQGRFGKIAIGVDSEGRIHVGRQVRPVELLRKQARRKALANASSVRADEREPWDESE